jgi:hypothetical protein
MAERVMNPSEIQSFRDRLGIDKLPDDAAKDGVCADWKDLPSVLASQVRKMKFLPGEIVTAERGLAELTRSETEIELIVYLTGLETCHEISCHSLPRPQTQKSCSGR